MILPSCVEGVAIGRIDLLRIGESTTTCCALWFAPHPEAESGMVEVYDCANPSPNAIPASHAAAIWLQGDDSCAPIEAPSNPSPADGATDVPLNVTLNCELHEAEFFSGCLPLGSTWVDVYFGTSPDPPRVGNGGPVPFRPRSVAPGTTYYWRVVYRYHAAAPVSSPLWSFTTANATPVETSTWGRIKAFYRR